MKYIEITQDGGGFLPSGSNNGFFTGKVETCSVFTFHGEHGYAVVHDTGQLKLKDVADFAKKCGVLKKVSYSINFSFIQKLQKKENDDRKNKLLRLIGFKGKVEKNDLPLGNLICLEEKTVCSESDFSDENIVRGQLNRLPEDEIRKSINILNNLFSKKNSQLLPLDIQYDDGRFQVMPKLLKSKKEMKVLAEHKYINGDSDYIRIFNLAKKQGII